MANKVKYKKHLGYEWNTTAVCGSSTSSAKLRLDDWLKLPQNERCPRCEMMRDMGASSLSGSAPPPPPPAPLFSSELLPG